MALLHNFPLPILFSKLSSDLMFLKALLAAVHLDLELYHLDSIACDVETRLRAENEARFRDLDSRLNNSQSPSNVSYPNTSNTREKSCSS
jgi:hypothetical protein